MDYRKYIFPINRALEGTGVLVGNLFITAGHVVEGSIEPSVSVDGENYRLTEQNRIVIETNPSKLSNGYDVAIYKLDGIESPLMLSDNIPNVTDDVVSYSYKTNITQNTEHGVGIFGSIKHEERLLERVTGKVIEYYDNFFECKMDEKLSQGRSGSPLFVNNKIVGILYGDKDGKINSSTVLYLSSNAILKLIKGKI